MPYRRAKTAISAKTTGTEGQRRRAVLETGHSRESPGKATVPAAPAVPPTIAPIGAEDEEEAEVPVGDEGAETVAAMGAGAGAGATPDPARQQAQHRNRRPT